MPFALSRISDIGLIMNVDDINRIAYSELVTALQEKLPGESAHCLMVPPNRKLYFHENERNGAISSAVLILFFSEGGVLKICLTQRAAQMKHHPGQISFPGGRNEPHEKTAYETALREASEEIGINIREIKLVGYLSEIHLPVSNFIVQPVVAWSDTVPVFAINHFEVERLIVLPVENFMRKGPCSKAWVETHMGTIEVPCYNIDGFVIWGATAMMLAELTMLLSLQIQMDREAH
jgi:8-oxo-dGTP pyrophosphatase MutT (NUDIX family)